TGDFARDVFKVWSLTTDNCANANDRIKLSRFRKLQSQQRNLKSAGHLVDFNPALLGAQTFKRIERALDQPTTNEIVPPTGNNRKTKSLTVKMTFVNSWLQYARAPSLFVGAKTSEYR